MDSLEISEGQYKRKLKKKFTGDLRKIFIPIVIQVTFSQESTVRYGGLRGIQGWIQARSDAQRRLPRRNCSK